MSNQPFNKCFNLCSKNSLLLLKSKIASIPHDIFLECCSVKDFKKIRYRLRKTPRPIPKKLDDTYQEYIDGNEKKLSVSFWGRGHFSQRSLLVIPTTGYNGISEFAKESTKREWLALFNRVKKETKKGQYISTHGFGVTWLHVRVEKKPRYYKCNE